jgi:hypothetical protein
VIIPGYHHNTIEEMDKLSITIAPDIIPLNVSRRLGIMLVIVSQSLRSVQLCCRHDSALPCFGFPGIQERALIQTPPSPQIQHWLNHASHGPNPALREFHNCAEQSVRILILSLCVGIQYSELVQRAYKGVISCCWITAETTYV